MKASEKNETKTSLQVNKFNETWIIDSGASHHITSKLTDFTNYTPYLEPEIIQTANVHDSLMIQGEGTVFFDTETTNGQIHTVRLDNVCYIPNRSNRLLSRCKGLSAADADGVRPKGLTWTSPTARRRR